TLSLFFTILATNFSAFYFLGFAGEGYRIGFAHYTIMAFGTAFAALSFYLIGTPVWNLGKKYGYITPGELIYGQTGSSSLRYLYAGVMMVYTLPYLALQIVGGGYILENLTDGEIPYLLGVVLLTVFTIVYVVIGGMQSVARTDLKQGLLVILFMLLALIMVSNSLGGLQAANTQLLELKPELFSIEGGNGHYTPQKWFSFMIFWLFCIPMFPQLFMRFYIARDLRHLKQSALLYAAIPLLISLFPVVIGALGHLSFPGLEGKAADQILPMMLVEHVGEGFSALIMTGAIAAFMSTLDSQLLALSTIMTRDFYLPISKKQLDFKQEVLMGRILVGVFAIIGLLIAIRPFATIFDMGKMAFAGLAVLFPLSLFIVRGWSVKPRFAIASILIGEGLLMAFYYAWLPSAYLMGFESFIPILAICFLIVFIGRGTRK
ncbi:MAG: sodium:solute symporter family protein, partial [Bacteroidota bacterium]